MRLTAHKHKTLQITEFIIMQDKLLCKTNFYMFGYNLQPQSVCTIAHASECDETPI